MNIGEFARLGGVSIRMLRHYDDLGLLRPERVDQSNGYRQYGAKQLERLRRLLALRDLGFTLAEIRGLLEENGDVAAALRARHAEITTSLRSGERQLAAIECQLARLGKDPPMTTFDIQIQSLPALHAASLRDPSLVHQNDQGGQDMSAMWKLLREKLPQAAHESGSTIIWHDMEGDQLPEPELLHPVQPGTPPPAPFTMRDLPPVPRAATLAYQGHYADQGMVDAFAALHRFGEDPAHPANGPVRQVFRGGEILDNRTAFMIELQLPLA